MQSRGNLFTPPLRPETGEAFELLLALRTPGMVMERIFSGGHTTPPGEWYDQAWDEIAVVVRGTARLEYENPEGCESLGPGDWLLIPAGRRHRVAAADADTVWLALHLRTDS